MNITTTTLTNRYPNWETLTDEQKRKAILLGLAANYPTALLSQENVAAFARALRDVPLDALQRIADFWADHYARFPDSPADLKIKIQQHNEAKTLTGASEKEKLEKERTAKCPFCDSVGWRYFRNEHGARTARKCTHRKSIESQFHGAEKGKTPGLKDLSMPVDLVALAKKCARKKGWK